jgi:hypothetical protein
MVKKKSKVRKTTDQFVEEAKLVHGTDKYGYDSVIYNGNKTNVIILCKIHGNFKQTPSNHLRSKYCCPACAGKVRINQDEFIAKAINVHGVDKYDYINVIYSNCATTVTIICKIHGSFNQFPDQHLKGRGCSRCSNLITPHIKSNKEEFICKANGLHGTDKYGYNKVIYNSCSKKVTITCKLHGDFEQTPNGHLSGMGCPKCGKIECGNKLRSNKDEFIGKANNIHGINNYNYDKVIYIRSDRKVTIACRVHGDFKQSPRNHLYGSGCPACRPKHSKQNRKLLG